MMPKFPLVTQQLIDSAKAKPAVDRTECERLVLALRLGIWVPATVLVNALQYPASFGARKSSLRAKGVDYITRPHIGADGKRKTIVTTSWWRSMSNDPCP